MTDLLDQNTIDHETPMSFGIRQLVRHLLPLAVLLALFNVASFESSAIASRAFAIAFLLVMPGIVLMSLTPLRPKEISVRLSLCVGTSILLLMLLGLFYSLVLQHLGIVRPLSHLTIVIGIDVVTVLALAVQVRDRDPLDYLTEGHAVSWNQLAVTGLLALLPLAAVAGAERLNNGDSGTVSLVVLIIIGVLLCSLVVFTDRVPRWSLGMSLYAASAAVLLMTSMRSNYPIGYDIQSEYYVFNETLRNGIWHLPINGDPYSAMLSITVLPTAISLATHASGTYLFKLVYPLVFSLFPVLVYVVGGRWFPVRAALIGAVVLIVQGFYSADMTGLARQEIGLLYFALLIVIAFDESIALRPRQVTAVMAGLGMAITHYSTAYFASIVLIFGFVAQLLFRRSRWWRNSQHILLSAPIVLDIVGIVILWNVVITRSAQNVVGLVTSLQTNGLQLLPGSTGPSLIARILNSDVTPTVSASKITSVAIPYFRSNYGYIHPYPVGITKLFPLKSIVVPVAHRSISPSFANITNDVSSVLNELLLLLIGIGIVVFLWRERKSSRGIRAEFGFMALGTVILLGILRLSGTVSTLYNAPRGQVQGAPLLSIGLACVAAWMFAGRTIKRNAFIAATAFGLGLLFFSDSGLSGLALGGGASDTLMNYGESYESYYFTTSDIASANWIVQHKAKGQVVYTDDYGAIQLDEVAKLNGVVPTIIPQVVEPGALVYADSSNIVDKTAYTTINNDNASYQFPLGFLNDVKNVVFSTGTTEVFR